MQPRPFRPQLVPTFSPPPTPEEEAEFTRLMRMVERDRGFNFASYKDKCLRRRVATRMRACHAESYAEYMALLGRDPAEYDRLLDALTINVTKFYRNPETWAAVREQVLPHLFAGPSRERRIWSAGSASGEEAYTLSILLHEWATEHGRLRELKQFAVVGSDIDRRSLEAAERAAYPEAALVDLPSELRERWFEPGLPAVLRAEARVGVRFERRDLLSESAPGAMELIVCRNVVIYFDRPTQESLFTRFYDALVPGGFLVLGKVETLLGEARARFEVVNGRERIFRKTR